MLHVLLVFIIVIRNSFEAEHTSCNLNDQIKFYKDNVNLFTNHADYQHLVRISKLFNDMKTINYTPTLFIAGLNQGDLLNSSVKCGSDFRFFGFEIQHHYTKKLRVLYSNFSNFKIYTMGVSNITTRLRVSGVGQMAGLYDEELVGFYFYKKKHKYKLKRRKTNNIVDVIKLANWTEIQRIPIVDYTSIDVEGSEASVIQGMELEKEANRIKFPCFQYELGGTWVEGDPRKPYGSLNQFGVAKYLTSLGYRLYLIGTTTYLPVWSTFFNSSALRIPGHSKVIQGNALAIHPSFSHPTIVRFLDRYNSCSGSRPLRRHAAEATCLD